MPCNTCGAAVTMESQTGGTKSGSFTENYECVNGHWGEISGEAGEPATQWRRTGPVFNEY